MNGDAPKAFVVDAGRLDEVIGTGLVPAEFVFQDLAGAGRNDQVDALDIRMPDQRTEKCPWQPHSGSAADQKGDGFGHRVGDRIKAVSRATQYAASRNRIIAGCCSTASNMSANLPVMFGRIASFSKRPTIVGRGCLSADTAK